METETACENYIWHGETYTTTGTYTYSYTNADGCPSVDTLHLTVNYVSDSTINVSVMEDALPYILNGESYDTSGTYYQTLTNASGCDSMLTIVLSVITTFLPDNVDSANCVFFPEGTEWGIQTAWQSENIVSVLNTPLVGDLDGDGIPEIVCFARDGDNSTGDPRCNNHLLVFDGRSKAIKASIILPSYVSGFDAAAYGLVRLPNGTGLIVVACFDYKLRAYDITAADPSIPYWVSDIDFGESGHDWAVNVSFADFNHDGHPEVFVRNKVYNAGTGVLLAAANTNTHYGASYAHWTNTGAHPYKLSSPIAADVCGDVKLDLILGNEVYDVNINNLAGTLGNSITLAQRVTPPGDAPEDGHPQVADFNHDGYLDVFVSVRNTYESVGYVYGYVWDIHNQTVSAPFVIRTGWSGKSIPLIADIDNDNLMEVLIQSEVSWDPNKFQAYKYHPDTRTFTLEWGFPTDENSYSNSITAFDFNQDGLLELMISDQNTMRIVNGSGISHITHADTIPMYVLNSFPFSQNTIMQYPVIADVDADGSAEIVSVGSDRLNILKSSTSVPWAPARKVWNQYMYNVTNVNEDLTIPQYLFNNATVFTDPEGIVRRPFNNFLQQATIIDRYGRPFYAVPDVAVGPSASSQMVGDSLVLNISYCNNGDNTLNAPYPVTVFANAYGGDTVCTVTVGENLPVDSCTQGEIRLPVTALCIFPNLDSLVIAVNGNSDGIAQNGGLQPECDTTNNAVTVIITMHTDTAHLTATACDSYLWYGDTLTQSGEYTHTLTNAAGCDSVEVLQLTIIPVPALSHTLDTIIIAGTSANLWAAGADVLYWTDSSGNILASGPSLTVSPQTSTMYYLTGQNYSAAAGNNLVVNGDFEQGNVGFTSAYTHVYTCSVLNEGYYTVGVNAHDYHPGFYNGPDQTTGTGNYMIINGAMTSNTNVWTQTVTVAPNTDYAFSIWVCSVGGSSQYPTNLAQLQFSVNGNQLGNIFTAPNAYGLWSRYYEVWNSGNNTSAVITILNQNTAAGGNDFGLDDIVFAPLTNCSVTDSIFVAVTGYPDNVDSADCTFLPEGTEWSIAQPIISNVGNAVIVSTPMVGDIDDDGQQEIVIPSSTTSIASRLNIYNSDGTLKTQFNIAGTYIWNSVGVAKVKWDNISSKTIIVVFGTNNYLYAYDATGAQLWQSNQPFSSHNGEWAKMPAISFVDFNHDGWVEIFVGSEIFDAATGVLLCKTNGNKGGADRTWSFGNTPYQTMAANLCGDSRLELAVGNTVYDVDIQSRTNYSANHVTIARQLPSSAMIMEDGSQIPFADGNTYLADINLDGSLDVIVMNVDGSRRIVYVYVWDVATSSIICSKKITNARKFGTPQIGDLDNDTYPEICFITGTYSDHGTGNNDNIHALKYNPNNSNGAMDVFWSIPHEDNSGSTGLTMFDFNQDGYVELVYRDVNNLRIINGSLYNHQTGQPVAQPYNLAYIPCHSATGVEYPVIADVDLDGEVEIIVGGETNSTDYGHLYIFKSAGIPWAPARKVWNQFLYNVTNVNEDLTIPQFQFNNATAFTDPQGVVRRPFNNFLQQATTIDRYGRPFYAVPDVAVGPFASSQMVGDSLVLTFSYCNLGDNTLNAPYPVTVFANAYGGDTVCTVTVGENLPVDSCTQGEIRLPISAVCGFANLDSLVIAVNGNSDGIAQNGSLQPECDTTNNTVSVAVSMHIDTTRLTATACDHYLWYSDTLTQSGEYAHTLTNAAGCDSVEVLQLTVITCSLPDNVDSADCTVFSIGHDWGIDLDWSSAEMVSPLVIPLVGDIDGDEVPEIICFAPNDSYTYYGSDRILIFNTLSHQIVHTINLPNKISTVDAAPYGIVRLPNGHAIVVVALQNYTMYAYDLTAMGTAPLWSATTNYYAPNVSFADFNGDTYPEVCIGNKIYDAETGTLLISDPSITNTASSWAHNGDTPLPSPCVANVVGDSKPDLILGNEIYEVLITNRNGTAGNSITLAKSIVPPAGVSVDGHPQVADFNLDGHLDVFVSKKDSKYAPVGCYVWDVYNNTVSNALVIPTTENGKSIPLIADVDNDDTLEIVIQCRASSGNKVKCYKYNAATAGFDFMWDIYVDEDSYSNSMSVFDFNNDGENDLLISDQTTVRIVNGSGHSHLTGNDTIPVYVLTSLSFGECTVMQYPIVADVDADGSAELVVLGRFGSGHTYKAYLNIFKSAGIPWAPARKVWNQYMYNVTNVNEDLTVPQYLFNNATVFTDPSGVVRRPFNNFLQQATTIDQYGRPFYAVPDVAVNNANVQTAGDSVTITVSYCNLGDNTLNAPYPVTVFANAYGGDTVCTVTVGENLPVDSCTQGEIRLPISAVCGFANLDSLVIAVNGNSDGIAQNGSLQPECDTTNNTVSVAVSMHIDTTRLTATACDHYLWYSDTLTQSGEYAHTLTNAAGCDSVEVLQLTIIPVPLLSHTLDTIIIAGTSANLWAAGADVLAWTDSSGNVLASGPSLTMSPTTPTMYYLTGQSSGCSTTDSVRVHVMGYPDNVFDVDCVFPPDSNAFEMVELFKCQNVNSMSTPMVADMDGDGLPEIIACCYTYSAPWYSAGFHVVNGQTGELKYDMSTVQYRNAGQMMTIADVDYDGKSELFLMGRDRKIYCYNYNGGIRWTSTNTVDNNYLLSAADVNNDGEAEIVCGKYIYNAQTGALLLEGTMVETGMGFGAPHSVDSYHPAYYMYALGDVDGDGTPELCAGNTVYKMHIVNTSGTTGNSWSILRQAVLPDSIVNKDGQTFIVDFDNDGDFDICVIGITHSLNNYTHSHTLDVYVWDGQTSQLIAHSPLVVNSEWGASIPYSGDLNGDGFPEIIFAVPDVGMLAYTYDTITSTMRMVRNHAPFGETSGFTVFDFNQDGRNEIVYRGTQQLFIVDGITLDNLNAPVTAYSGTVTEYPVVADVNADGHAEIIVTRAYYDWSSGNANGWVAVYGSQMPGAWSSARKVWNQWAYSSVNINEDMTVPQYRFDVSTTFPNGKKPFNSFLRQMPYIDSQGDLFNAAADVAVAGANAVLQGDTVVLSLNYCNTGDNILFAPYPVTVFANAYGGDTVCTVTVGENLPVDSCTQGEIRLPISAVCGFANLDSLVIAVNGNSDGIAQNGSLQPECDTTNNTVSVAVSMHIDTTRLTATACDHYLWYSDTLTQSGEYTQVLANAVGCDSIVTLTLQISPYPTAIISGPAVLCGDSAVTLVADSAFSYLWSTGDTTRSISVTEEGVYALTVANELGCTASASHQLFFLDNPILSVTVPDMCAGGSYTLSVGYQSDDNINLGQGETTLSMTDTIFLPDGIYCAPFGCSYRSPLTFSAYAPGDTIQSVEDIYYVRLNMEHSYIGDLYINITCPNGQKADLLKYGGSGSSDCSSQIPSSSRGWASGYNMSVGTSFGDANTFSTSSCDASAYGNEPGVGWNYCWSENTTQGYTYAPGTGSLIYRGQNAHQGIVDSSDVASGTHFYHPDDSFSNLIGCPLNGDWYIEVQDGWSVDNGYIFGWELSLNADALPDMDFELDYSTVDGPWITTLSDSLFQVNPPVGLEHDTVVAYTFTVYDTTGCGFDTTVYVNVYATRYAEVNASACDNFTWNDSVYTVSGQYVQTFTSAVGCDSVVTLHLTINHETNGDTTVVACGSFTWHGVTYTTTPAVAPTYTMTGGNHNGCDSVVTLHLTVNHSTDGDTTVVACESFTWHGVTYTTTPAVAPTYTMTGGNHNGCDSVVTLHLTVNHGTHDVLETDACESYEWHGTTYTTSGTYTYAYTDANGCSSVDTLHLTVHYGTHNVLDTTVCESYEWHGETYTVSDTYIHLYTNANDCPSADTLHLTISSGYEYNFEEVICEGDAYNNHGFVVPSAQTIGVSSMNLTQNLQSQHGCDSILNVSLTIIDTAVQIIPLTEDFCDNMSMELSVVTSMADYVWSTGENSSVITVSAPGLYSVTASEDGCGATAGYAVDECDFMMVLPNAITPSVSDGVNDYFELPEVYQNRMYHFTITIYNRWGGVVFSSHDKSFRWNGEVNGEIPTNVLYNYIIQYKDRVGSSFLLKGSLLVL